MLLSHEGVLRMTVRTTTLRGRPPSSFDASADRCGFFRGLLEGGVNLCCRSGRCHADLECEAPIADAGGE